jgi:hypothetical protein
MQPDRHPHHPARRPILLLVALCLMAAAPAGKEPKQMKTISVEQLGNVSPRQSVGSWRGNEAIEPMPIVQWQNGEVWLAYFHEWKTNTILGSYKESITPLPAGAGLGRAAQGNDYPIRFSGHARGSHAEREMAAFDLAHHVAADLTGDGIDELILPRHQGTLDVYGSQGKIGSWTAPGRDEKYYASDAVLVHKAKQGNRELVYVVYRTEPYSDTKIPDAVASAHATSPIEVIAEVSLSGVRTVPVLGLPGALSRILGLAYFVPAGGQPELVIASRLDVGGNEKDYLSRHRLDGSPIAPPREIYANLSEESRMEFVTFQPGDPCLIAVGTDNSLTAFVWPAKEVNWFKAVAFNTGWRMGETTLFKGVVDRKSGRPKVLFQKGRTLYVRDDDGRCYQHVGNRYVPAETADEITEWQEIPPTSQYHRLAQIRLLEGDDDALLVLEVRRSGRKELSLEEARDAGKRFLPPEFVEKVEKENGLTFQSLMAREKYMARVLREQLPAANLKTLEDVKRFAPKFYEDESASILSHLQLKYQMELCAPLDSYKPPAAEEPRYRNIPQYKDWLKSLYFGAAVQVRVISGATLVANHTLDPATIYSTSPAPGIPMRWVVTRRSGERLNIVLPMVIAKGDVDVVGTFQLKLR